MENSTRFESLQPRQLRYRSHYRVYLMFFSVVALLVISFWAFRLYYTPWSVVLTHHQIEIWISAVYLASFGASYLFWLRSRLQQSVQVFNTHLLIKKGKRSQEILFSEIESVMVVCWSLFYLKMKNGHKHYFNSSLERVDYIWEGVKNARPELIADEEFEKFRVNLVQYDHHQKRKEWFFRHKFVDVINWVVLPLIFLAGAYLVQSRDIMIHQHGLYFFRLFMYSLLVLLICAFLYSLVLKKFVFDRKVEVQLEQEPSDKLRDLEFEGLIIQRSKIFQMITACFIFAMIIKADVNLYSVTKLKSNIAYFNLETGRTLVIDNRFNCFDCKYRLNDGDFVVFGRGHVGQIMAKEGEMVGEIAQDSRGRMIASHNVQEVPVGHLAIKADNGRDIIFVRIDDLIGKIQK